MLITEIEANVRSSWLDLLLYSRVRSSTWIY